MLTHFSWVVLFGPLGPTWEPGVQRVRLKKPPANRGGEGLQLSRIGGKGNKDWGREGYRGGSYIKTGVVRVQEVDGVS